MTVALRHLNREIMAVFLVTLALLLLVAVGGAVYWLPARGRYGQIHGDNRFDHNWFATA